MRMPMTATPSAMRTAISSMGLPSCRTYDVACRSYRCGVRPARRRRKQLPRPRIAADATCRPGRCGHVWHSPCTISLNETRDLLLPHVGGSWRVGLLDAPLEDGTSEPRHGPS